jgi:hypothetical protein
MIHWPDFRLRRERPYGQRQPIDMGNGRFLTAEDVLEGHFHRLATKTVQVQVKPDLRAALTILAPDLAPLTEVAEEVAQALPRVQPAAQFRQDLHRALERTHRQHLAQRKLGTRPVEASSPPWAMLLVIAGIIALLLGLLVYRQNYRRAYTHSV